MDMLLWYNQVVMRCTWINVLETNYFLILSKNHIPCIIYLDI